VPQNNSSHRHSAIFLTIFLKLDVLNNL